VLSAVAIDGPDLAVPGQPRTFDLSATSTSSGPFTYNIDWDGDGTVDETAVGSENIQASHVFTALGSVNVTVTVTDPDEGTSQPVQHPLSVDRFSLQVDEDNPAVQNLVWGGTEGLDAVFFLPSGGGVLVFGAVIGGVFANAQDFFPQVSGKIIVYGLGGSDIIAGEFISAQNQQYFGGNGDDVLFAGIGDDEVHGGAGNDIVVGGTRANDGDDRLFGDADRDILLGGVGGDQLDGGDDDDILIAGELDTPNVIDMISDIKFAWLSSGSYAQRVAAVEALGVYLGDGGQKGINEADPLADDLEAAWSMRGSAEDLTGNGHDGALQNGASFVLDPQQGAVVEINPDTGPPDQYISVPDDDDLDRQDNWSVSVLVKLDDDFTSAPRTLFAKRSSGSAYEGGWAITYGINGGANHNRFQVSEFKGGGPGGSVSLNTESGLSPFVKDTWTMISVVFKDGGALEGGTTSIYINGVYNVDRQGNGPVLWNTDLAIGARPLNPGAAWDGQIGVAYFHAERALTAQEAAALAADPTRLIRLPQDVLFGGEGNDWYAREQAVDEIVDLAAGETVLDL